MHMLSLAAENEMLKRDLSKTSLEHVDLQRELNAKEKECISLKQKIKTSASFSVESVINDEKLLTYYTGFKKEPFLSIYKFLVPQEETVPLTYVGKGKLSQVKTLSLQNQLFLTLCKLRNDMDLADLAFRFEITSQTAGVIFNSWVNYMFLRFGEVSIWPPREVLYAKMPEQYRKEFPGTFAIADCTELKIQKPSSLKAQTQTYSNYKSTNTLKGLVVVDPRGSVIFSSTLFAGAISDKQIFIQSGLQSLLKQLVATEYLKEGDGIMGDKGFDIGKEVEETGLKLNIPPFAKSGCQMAKHDVLLTQKIARHRVHVERAIRRIKSFKILSGRIRLALMSSINQIWFVCSFLTNFMPPCIQKD